MQGEANSVASSRAKTRSWDSSSHEKFYEYYAQASQSPKTLQRFRSIQDTILGFFKTNQSPGPVLDVADIGCGAGTQSLLWAQRGHRVHGIDLNAPLLELARERAASAGYAVEFQVGSAVELPWADESMDVCLNIELLEHVVGWMSCLSESARVTRPGGILFLTTTNKLCPKQEEFRLPAYGWYPGPVKRYFEKLATTTHPQLADYARYPAVNWFSFYGLQRVLAARFQCFDRFDLVDLSGKGALAKWIVTLVRVLPTLRWLAHVSTPGTILLAMKHKSQAVPNGL